MIGDLKPYAAYKDSGVPQLGDVPTHWAIQKLRNILFSNTKRNRPDLPLLSIAREKGVILRDVDSKEENHNFIPDDLTNYKVVRNGQFAMNKMKAWQGSYGVSAYDGIVSPAYFVFDINKVIGKYLHTAIRSQSYIPFFTQASDGVRIGQWDLSQARMREIPFFVPPIEEQTAIATFLDYADRRIRRYIRSKQKLIKLLEEEKQVVINEAVTRGLDPNVPMKRSGIEWLGDVPEHWEVKRLKLLFREVDSRSTTGKEILLSLRMHRGLVPHNEVSEKPIEEEALKGFKKVTMGQLVMNRMRAAIGMFATVPQIGIVSPDYAIFEPIKTADPSYYVSLFKTSTLCSIFRLESKGLGTGSSGFMRLYTDRFGLIKVPVPPKEEQEAITLWIQKTTQEFETAKQRAAQEIVLLNEFRTRMIADVVTGKLDVREAAAKLPVEIDELEALDEDLDEDVMGLEDELDPDAAPEDDAA